MIYRILAASRYASREETEAGISPPDGRLAGGFMAGLQGFNVRMPKLQNPKARFYFTEKGWEQVGKQIVAKARLEGRRVRVWRRKNPHPSQIVYQDELQIALLPRRDPAR